MTIIVCGQFSILGDECPHYGPGVADLAALQGFQRGAYRDWANRFAAHLRSQGKPADGVTTDWPYRPMDVTA